MHDEHPASGLVYGDPFTTPAGERRDDRRFRGRLLSPVTVWTARAGSRRAGLTVSSVAVAEGDPAILVAVIDPLSVFLEVARETLTAVVHILTSADDRIARLFAGHYPVDPFEEVRFVDSDYGPRLDGDRTLAEVSALTGKEAGFQSVVTVRVDSIRLAEHPAPPLGWYRGAFISTGAPEPEET